MLAEIVGDTNAADITIASFGAATTLLLAFIGYRQTRQYRATADVGKQLDHVQRRVGSDLDQSVNGTVIPATPLPTILDRIERTIDRADDRTIQLGAAHQLHERQDIERFTSHDEEMHRLHEKLGMIQASFTEFRRDTIELLGDIRSEQRIQEGLLNGHIDYHRKVDPK